jgi:hypothetical protein
MHQSQVEEVMAGGGLEPRCFVPLDWVLVFSVWLWLKLIRIIGNTMYRTPTKQPWILSKTTRAERNAKKTEDNKKSKPSPNPAAFGNPIHQYLSTNLPFSMNHQRSISSSSVVLPSGGGALGGYC